MKRKVKIYKSPDGNGAYLNKTAKFLYGGSKMQPGGETSNYNEQILMYVAQEILENEKDPEEVYKVLLESKIDEATALKHIQAIMQYQQEQIATQQQAAPQQQALEQDTAYSQAADEVEEDLLGQYGYYNPSGVGTELANDDSTQQTNEEADEDVYNMVMGEDQTVMQDGGSIDDYIKNEYIPTLYANGGVPRKSSFIKNVMSKLKEAREGLEQEQQDPSEKFDMTDTLTLDRGKKQSKFVEGLVKTTQIAKDKKKAEEMYAMQQQQMQPMNPMLTAKHGFTMPSPREYRRMHRTVNRALPNMYLDPNIAEHTNMTVTDTDWLGRPKQYTMDFGGQQGIMPGWMNGRLLIGLPGGANMGVGNNSWSTSWGSNWNTVKGIVETTKVKREGIIRNINKKADPAPNGQSKVDNVVGDQSKVVKDENGNPIISDGSNMQWNDIGTKLGKVIGASMQGNDIGTNLPTVSSTPSIEKTYQMGGFSDPESGLTRFIYGGDEDMIDDYSNSINTADPYFGRMYRNGGVPRFVGGGQWVTKPDGTTIFLNDDGTIDKTKTVMSDDEQKIYDDNIFKRNKEYYDKNKDKFTNQTEQQKLIDEAINKRMVQYNNQTGQGYNSGYNYNPGYRSNGFLDQIFSANLAPNYLGTWSKLKGLETSDGIPFTGFDKNTSLNNIKITKSGWLSGRPKEYEMNFSKYIDPRTANNISLNPNTTTTNTTNTGAQPNGTRYVEGMTIGKDQMLKTNTDANGNPMGIDSKGRLVSSKAPAGTSQASSSQPAPQPTAEQTNMMNQVSNFLSGRGAQPAPSNQPIPTFNKNTTGNYSDFNQSNMPNARIDGTAQPAPAQPAPVSGIPYNTSGPMNMMDEEGMAYGGYIPGYMAYGGYLPTAVGGNNPVDYTSNPAFIGKSNLDLISTYDNMGTETGLQPSTFWSDMNSFDAENIQGQKLADEYLKDCTEDDKRDPTSKCYEGIKLDTKDPMSLNPENLKKEMMDKQDIKAKFKNKDITQWDTGALLAVANKSLSTIPKISDTIQIGNLQKMKMANKTSDNLYASNVATDPYQKTGQTSLTGSTTGLDFARDQGQLQYGQTQSGGALELGGTTYMTADEIKRFMEAGGQIEYI